MGDVDRGYINLLSILRDHPSSVALNVLISGISHYLSHALPGQPSPTPLVETIAQSPIWLSLSLQQYIELGNAFGQALLSVRNELEKQQHGLFTPLLSYSLRQWLNVVLNGLKAAHPLTRLTIYRGVLLAMDSNLEVDKLLGPKMRKRINRGAVLAFAEVIDHDEDKADKVWLKEFTDGDVEEERDRAIILAAQYFTKLPTVLLAVLNPRSVVPLLLDSVVSAFMKGDFLADGNTSMSKDDAGMVTINKTSQLSVNLREMNSSDKFNNIAQICRLLAYFLGALATNGSASKHQDVCDLLDDVITTLDELAAVVEERWDKCLLSAVKQDDNINEESRDIAKSVWKILKTLVFAIIMIQLPVLGVILYQPNAISLCIRMVQTLSRLSPVIMQLGGVSAMPSQVNNVDEYQFKELKQVFFMAMDIIASDHNRAEELVKQMAGHCGPADGNRLQQAKRAFTLSCVEQLMPCLSDACITEYVLPLCQPHLSEYDERATYESAHSVILSIFAKYAKESTEQVNHTLNNPRPATLAEQLVPGYARCLLENVMEGRLTTAQFRLAYSTLVRSAGSRTPSTHHTRIGATKDRTKDAAPNSVPTALAKLCISSLITESKSPSLGSSEQHRIHLTLTSLISDVTLELLPYLLGEVGRVIDNEADPARRKTLIDVAYEEMMEKVGDKEKDEVLRWWLEGTKQWNKGGRTIAMN